MSRKYANILTAIWRNEDFKALDSEEQRMYLLLTSQPDISAAGVLHLSVTRWSAMARNTPPAAVAAALQGLARGRFVIYDIQTEELLVRSFVRWDGGYTNSKRRPVIRDAAQEILSPTIRRALALEFQRLGLPDALSDSPSDTTPDTTPDEEPPEIGEILSAQGNRLSDTASDAVSPSERVVVTVVPTDPQPSTRKPSAPTVLPAPVIARVGIVGTNSQPSTTPGLIPDEDLSKRDSGLFPSMAAGHPAIVAGTATSAPTDDPQQGPLTVNQRSRMITNAYAEVEPMSKWVAVNGIVAKAIRTGRWADEAIHEALLRLAAEGRPVTVDTLRIELDGFTPHVNGRASSRQLVEHNGLQLKPETIANLERSQRFAAMDAANEHHAIEGPK